MVGQDKKATHLVNEAGEAVVQGLDLLFFLSTDSLDGGVDVEVQGGQQALVDLDVCDWGNGHTATHASTHAKTTSTSTEAAAAAVAADAEATSTTSTTTKSNTHTETSTTTHA